MITSQELGQHFKEVAETLAAFCCLLYTAGLVIGSVVFRTYDKVTPILGLVPRRGSYKAPQAASAPVQALRTKSTRKRPSRAAKKPALA